MRGRRILRATKLYADLVADDGTACAATLLRVRVPGVTRVLGEAELFHRGGGSEVLRAVRADAPDSVRDADGRVAVRMDLTEGPFSLRYAHPQRPARPPGRDPFPGLRWVVEIPRSPVVCRWPGGGGRVMRGEGYVDRVVCEGLPRRLGVQELVWGRAHAPSVTAVYTGIRVRDGREWLRSAVWDAARGSLPDPTWHDRFRLQERPDGWLLQLDGGPTLRTRHGRVLRHGPLVDRRRSLNRIERTLVGAVLGPGRQARHLDPLGPRPNAEPAGVPERGWLLHEFVRFE